MKGGIRRRSDGQAVSCVRACSPHYTYMPSLPVRRFKSTVAYITNAPHPFVHRPCPPAHFHRRRRRRHFVCFYRLRAPESFFFFLSFFSLCTRSYSRARRDVYSFTRLPRSSFVPRPFLPYPAPQDRCVPFNIRPPDPHACILFSAATQPGLFGWARRGWGDAVVRPRRGHACTDDHPVSRTLIFRRKKSAVSFFFPPFIFPFK